MGNRAQRHRFISPTFTCYNTATIKRCATHLIDGQIERVTNFFVWLILKIESHNLTHFNLECLNFVHQVSHHSNKLNICTILLNMDSWKSCVTVSEEHNLCKPLKILEFQKFQLYFTCWLKTAKVSC